MCYCRFLIHINVLIYQNNTIHNIIELPVSRQLPFDNSAEHMHTDVTSRRLDRDHTTRGNRCCGSQDEISRPRDSSALRRRHSSARHTRDPSESRRR